jgi:hypothetical protein
MNGTYYFECLVCGYKNDRTFDALSGPPVGKPMTCENCGSVDPLPKWIIEQLW